MKNQAIKEQKEISGLADTMLSDIMAKIENKINSLKLEREDLLEDGQYQSASEMGLELQAAEALFFTLSTLPKFSRSKI